MGVALAHDTDVEQARGHARQAAALVRPMRAPG
jgi:formate-dependent phosphoribosylglycinamide formyltransferase (GAR transformylase)